MHVVVSGIHVEFGFQHILIRDPTVNVVVDGYLRVPVTHEIEMVIAPFASVGWRQRGDVGPCEIERKAIVRHERLLE
jgi:hypothetical protein